jgi:hypothetical protein
LLSKAMIDPHSKSRDTRYSFAQVQRLKRLGAREFLRLDQPRLRKRLETMGDCGSFSYANEPEPPYNAETVIEFYLDCQFDYGISPDHVILGYNETSERSAIPEDWRNRFAITLDRANEFLAAQRKDKLPFTPIGAAQGWSPKSYQEAVTALQKMGYDYIAVGGMVPLRTPQLMRCLAAVAQVRQPRTKLHLLGITRLEQLEEFNQLGVYSLDSTSPLKQAFMDDRHNYHTLSRTYIAVRIPQVEGNAQLKKLILAGVMDFAKARRLETAALDAVLAYDKGELGLDLVIDRLREYEALWHGAKDDSARYRETLEDRPWQACPCAICKKLGVHVVLFRGAERNRSRGFHNLDVLRRRLNQLSQPEKAIA